MPNSPDAELVLRDPGIPGLALVLNAEALRRALAVAIPDRAFRSLAATYMRYKPGTSCLVAYATDSPAGQQVAYAKAYARNAHDKLRNARERARSQGPFGPRNIVLENAWIEVCVFPHDNRLKVLHRLADPRQRRRLVRKLMPDQPTLWGTEQQCLRYKPERRYVARLGDGRSSTAVLKAYTKDRYSSARAAARSFVSRGNLRLPALLGRSARHALLAFEWLPGRNLAGVLRDQTPGSPRLRDVGSALAELHAQTLAVDLPQRSHAVEADNLAEAAGGIAALWPPLAAQATRLAERIATGLRHSRPSVFSIHGDFYADQVLLDNDRVGIVDLDCAARGSPELDLGSFCAHLERDVLDNRMSAERAARFAGDLLAGYQAKIGRVDSECLRLYKAARLLRLAVEPFRRRESDWSGKMRALLERAEELLDSNAERNAVYATVALGRTREASGAMPRTGTGSSAPGVLSDSHGDVVVTDPQGVGDDPCMPFVADALIPQRVEPRLIHCLAKAASEDLGFDPAEARLRAIRVVRYKPMRRCLIEYDLSDTSRTITLMGKVRARGLDRSTYQLQSHLWNNGFNDASQDGISVPRPLGVLPELNMWLYHKAPGVPATDLWAEPAGEDLAPRVAQLAHKLHRGGFVARWRHTMADELRILRERLPEVLHRQPHWGDRLERVLDACYRLGNSFADPLTCGIHRDFYADQILVDEDRLYLIDLDLYCQGDPGLDIGNFQGHLTELALRTLGNAHALVEREQALEDAFLSLAGSRLRTSIKVYATLTLVRHIYLSTRFAERNDFTERLLDLCEERLGISSLSAVGGVG